MRIHIYSIVNLAQILKLNVVLRTCGLAVVVWPGPPNQPLLPPPAAPMNPHEQKERMNEWQWSWPHPAQCTQHSGSSFLCLTSAVQWFNCLKYVITTHHITDFKLCTEWAVKLKVKEAWALALEAISVFAVEILRYGAFCGAWQYVWSRVYTTRVYQNNWLLSA